MVIINLKATYEEDPTDDSSPSSSSYWLTANCVTPVASSDSSLPASVSMSNSISRCQGGDYALFITECSVPSTAWPSMGAQQILRGTWPCGQVYHFWDHLPEDGGPPIAHFQPQPPKTLCPQSPLSPRGQISDPGSFPPSSLSKR